MTFPTSSCGSRCTSTMTAAPARPLSSAEAAVDDLSADAVAAHGPRHLNVPFRSVKAHLRALAEAEYLLYAHTLLSTGDDTFTRVSKRWLSVDTVAAHGSGHFANAT